MRFAMLMTLIAPIPDAHPIERCQPSFTCRFPRLPGRQETGFSLVEVLVALFVLSLGLLGLATLQTMGLKFNQQSYQRTQAVLQAYDIIDRMRANTSSISSYVTPSPGYLPSITSGQCLTSDCTPAQLAAYDVNNWNTSNARLLAEGKGSISNSGSRWTVTITWKENDLPMTLSVEADL